MISTAPMDVRDPAYYDKLRDFLDVSRHISSIERSLLHDDGFMRLRETMVRLAQEDMAPPPPQEGDNNEDTDDSSPDTFIAVPGPGNRKISTSHASVVRDSAPLSDTNMNGGAFYTLRKLEHENLIARLKKASLEVDLLNFELGLSEGRFALETKFVNSHYGHGAKRGSVDGFAMIPFAHIFPPGLARPVQLPHPGYHQKSQPGVKMEAGGQHSGYPAIHHSPRSQGKGKKSMRVEEGVEIGVIGGGKSLSNTHDELVSLGLGSMNVAF
ncbi:hypothetical protein Hypma_003882 [Hypsizygus marmoreus]|uniref:Uncharacterized protein n=1 Tax=Hypsizygus marmoreus TaxID=39966 RepID=A0A369JYZ5_HYPMA|nr:hypothetical protein Hypma_003882 [Hypsizygus marmoreus]